MRNMRSKSGEVLVKRIHVKVFLPQNRRRLVRHVCAPDGRGFSWHDINAQLRAISDQIEKEWPGEEYAMVPTGPDSYNFVWLRTKELAQESPAAAL
jgi:hypothetical protein